jgi:protein arginine N-methyltransferase 1
MQAAPTAFTHELPEQEVLGQYIPLLYHYNMLQDEDRVGAFHEAIRLTVQPGMHVVELGGGTGILSSFAARQGARVSCVERNPELVRSATKFIRENGLADRVSVIHADAARFVPDSRVDVVVCEMLHVGLLREKQANVISSFKQHYTSVFGRKLPLFIPEASILMVQPVEQSFEFWGYSAPVPLFQAACLHQPRTSELAPLSPYANISYDDAIPLQFRVRQSITCQAPGRLNALRFVTQNIVAIELHAQRAVTWPNQCLVLPIDEPFDVIKDQTIEVSFEYEAGGSIDSLSASIDCRS